MARKLDKFPKASRQSKYPWSDWLNGEPWLLRRGEDYKTSSESMRAIASKAAIAAGKRVRTQIITDQDGTEALVIQARPD